MTPGNPSSTAGVGLDYNETRIGNKNLLINRIKTKG